MKIFIVEDHAMIREGLRLIIQSRGEMEVIGEAEDGETAVKRAKETLPDVILMDMSLPGLSSAQATERIKVSCPQTRVIALSAHQDEITMQRMLSVGASGYLLKSSPSWQLVEAIRTVARGGVYVDPKVTALSRTALSSDLSEPLLAGSQRRLPLTSREQEVLELVAWGYTNIEIAAKLHLNVKTIEGHKSHIGHKLGIPNRAGMVVYALRRGWLNEE